MVSFFCEKNEEISSIKFKLNSIIVHNLTKCNAKAVDMKTSKVWMSRIANYILITQKEDQK